MNVALLLQFVTPTPAVVTTLVPMFVLANPVLLEMEKLAAVRNRCLLFLVVTVRLLPFGLNIVYFNLC